MPESDPTPNAQLPTLCLTPRRPALLAGHDNTLDVLVRIQAPDAPATLAPRPPLNLSLVIDRSGSMSGQPLAEAKRCAEFVLDGLQPTDRLSLVVYDDGVDTLVPAAPVADTRDVVRRAIRQIDDGGSTNLHGGWLHGALSLRPHVAADAVSRVILLSDGCANAGLVDPDAIFTQVAQLAAAGVGTSTYGLGHGFNEHLMLGMAQVGQGRSYYGQTADDLMDPFREELELLNALCARGLQLEVVPAPGVQVKLLNEYVAVGEHAWTLPDLAYAGEAWALLRLKVPAALAEGSEGTPLLSVSVRYTGLDGEPRAIQPQSFTLPAYPASAFHAISEDALVLRRVGELEAAELQQKARAAAMRGDWDTVMRLLRRAQQLGAENPWIASVLAELQALADRRDAVMFAKESAYSAHRMHSRLAAKHESGDVRDVAGAAYLRRKANQGKRDDDAKTPRH